MKFTISWLKEHLDYDATLDDLTDRLTSIGLEVEDVSDRACGRGCTASGCGSLACLQG